MPHTPSNDLDHEIECERCGRCLTVCPVYREKRIETFSPRGRLDLIRAVSAGELAPKDRYKESIHSCLQCMACLNACPKGVEAATIIRREKIRMIRENPDIRHKTEAVLLKLALGKPRLMIHAARLAGAVQNRIKTRPVSTDRLPLSRHLPLFLPGILAGRRIPDICPEKSRFTYPETIFPPAHIPCKGEILLFPGCFFGHVDTRPLTAAIRVLVANGIKIHLPRHQVCCGAPAALGGHPDILKQGCVQNLSALEGSLPVITLCATCGNALKNEYPRMFQPDENRKEIAENLGRRVKDIAQFLMELNDFAPGPRPIDPSVTLHMPCHLNQGMKVGDPVLALLKRLPRLDFKKMDGMENCCGGGGLCALNNPGLSKELGDRKALTIVNSGARIVAAPCPGCLIQIKDRLGTDTHQIESVHPIELVAKTYGG
jgi:glycolate dehydrogenase iron-sulfur subunit